MAAEGCYLVEADITWPAGYTEAKKQAVIDKVEQIIDKVTGTHWCATAFDIKLNGNNKNRLFIPLETDILSVTQIFINCVELDSSWWTYDINSVFLDPCIGDSMWGSNAIQDGDFYNWKVAAPTTDLYYWVESVTPTSTINRDTLQVQVGNYCVRMDIDGANNQAQIRQRIQLFRNRNYTLFFKYMNSKAAKRAKFMLYNADLNISLLGNGTWATGKVYVSLPTSGGYPVAPTPYVPTWIDYSLSFTSHTDYAGYELYLENETIWEVDFDGGQNEPAIGDDLGTPSDNNFVIDSYVLTSGLWDGTGVGKLWLRKAGAVACGWLDNEDITNNTQVNTLAGGAGLGVNGAVATVTAGSSSIYFDNVGILTAGIAAIASDISAGIFPHGFNNVQIIGTHGESSVPEAIKQAGIAFAEWEADPASHAAGGLMKSEKIGDYSYTNLATEEADVLTGIDKVDMYLRHYIKRKAILMAP